MEVEYGGNNLINEEYKVLNNEVAVWKRFMIERPLAISVLLFIGFKNYGDKCFFIFPLIALILLMLNLYFTVNRVKSNSIIVAYIQIIIETNPDKWLGWESSIHYFRESQDNGIEKNHKTRKGEQVLKEIKDSIVQYL